MVISFKKFSFYILFTCNIFTNNVQSCDNTIPQVIEYTYNNETCQFETDIHNYDFYELNNFSKPICYSIHDHDVRHIYHINIMENKNINYYIDLLNILINNKKKLNQFIVETINNSKDITQSTDYNQLINIKVFFNLLLDDILYKINTSNYMQKYNIFELINKFRNSVVDNDNNEALDYYFNQFQNNVNEYLSNNNSNVNKKPKIFNIIKTQQYSDNKN